MGIIINRKSHDCICNRDRVGGDEGNRTPVRKNLAKGFSERSWCFKSPSVHRPSTGYALWQLLSCDRVRSAPLFTFTSNRRPTQPRYSVQERAALRLLKQLFCCQLILKLRILWRFRTAARLPRFEIPVETFTSPYSI